MDVQAQIQAMIDELVADGTERGLQVAAYYQGEQIVDAWAGVADPATGRAVDGDTLFVVFSCSKGVAATALHILASRGQIDYDAPVATYWPEFAQNGKEAVTVRHVLTHTSGLHAVPAGITRAQMCDWEYMVNRMAQETPRWVPGSHAGYQALTFGWLVGEIVRRAGGQPIEEVVQEEICAPLGINSLFFGAPAHALGRIAVEESVINAVPAAPGSHAALSTPDTLDLTLFGNWPDVHQAVIPGAGGVANARALARMYASLARAWDGPALLPPEWVHTIGRTRYAGPDQVTGTERQYALGYEAKPSWWPDLIPWVPIFGHGGFGGFSSYADPTHRYAFSLATNRLKDDANGPMTAYRVDRSLRQSLGLPV
jgi:CubicO group peptidase (beta-lactamase class C family)